MKYEHNSSNTHPQMYNQIHKNKHFYTYKYTDIIQIQTNITQRPRCAACKHIQHSCMNCLHKHTKSYKTNTHTHLLYLSVLPVHTSSTHKHPHVHTYTNTHIHSCCMNCLYKHTNTHSHTNMHTLTHKHTQTHNKIHTQSHINTHSNTQTNIMYLGVLPVHSRQLFR